MNHKHWAGSLLGLFLVLFLAACGTQPLPIVPPVGQTPAPGTTVEVPGETVFGFSQFVDALTAAGATVGDPTEIEQPFFPVTGQALTVNGSDVQAFEFNSEVEREQISATISENGDQIGASIPEWVDAPNFWANGRLIVLYVGQDEALVALLTSVLGEPIAQPTPSANVSPEAVLAAQTWLAEQLSAGAERVEIVSMEQVEWSDSCLGLGQANESCAAVVTPGWRVIFNVDGKEYEVRTDATGSVVRMVAPEAPAADLTGTNWMLESIGQPGAETPVVAGSEVTLIFGADGRVTGSGGCNIYNGGYVAEAGGLTFQPLGSTKRACADESMTQQEQVYLAALQAANQYEMAGDRLVLIYPDGVINFVQAPTAGAPNGLEGTSWTLGSYGDVSAPTPVVVGSVVTLNFGADGQAAGSGGCNSFGGGYTADGGALTFEPLVATERACTETALMQQEQDFFQALQSVKQYDVTGDRLTLTYADGALVFAQAAPPAATVLCASAEAASSGWLVCQSQANGFEVQYPPDAALADNAEQHARIDLAITPGTNLTEKYLELDVNDNVQECASPLTQGRPAGDLTTETVTINGVDFVKQQGVEAAAGNTYDVTAYSTVSETKCVSLSFVLRSHTPELEPTPPPVFDRTAEAAIFEDIAGTFHWLTASVDVTPTPVVSGDAWTRQQFGNAWDIAYPAGWTVNAAGAAEGAIQLEGSYGTPAQTFHVDLSYPIGLSAQSLEAWVQAEVSALTADEQAVIVTRDVAVAGAPAKLVLNMPAANGGALGHRVYIWRTASVNPRLISASQIDGQPFDSDALAAFLERFITEMRSPAGTAQAAEARVLGILDFFDDGSEGVVTVPATVRAGQDFQVTVSTFGGGCERAGDTDVILASDGATLMVYDFTTAIGPDVVCTAILKRLDHTVTLHFAEPGEKIIRIWGRRLGVETAASGEPVVLEQTVVVN